MKGQKQVERKAAIYHKILPQNEQGFESAQQLPHILELT